jgi:hypothetical protein
VREICNGFGFEDKAARDRNKERMSERERER